MNVDWLIPVLKLVNDYCSLSEISKQLDLPTSTLRKAIFVARRLGLVEKDDCLRLTESGQELLSNYDILQRCGKKFYLKKTDGCILVLVRRKKGFKAIRIPCDNVPSCNSS
ncbi:hypothetical protein IPA_04430 [Ignicoccus pacificus DSM 13166]|uniref:ArnR1-like winged helix-turn-helix domain-containing protein n=1 Tax=Ignicoccus pacificus DSM 13166 TaxID=940294 RepID=A0A977KCL9_9CREN|nr:hypothetical protein IPA_04430 [Ignicoccus pacificus DSM 13166]